jgi:hypothetical protein
MKQFLNSFMKAFSMVRRVVSIFVLIGLFAVDPSSVYAQGNDFEIKIPEVTAVDRQAMDTGSKLASQITAAEWLGPLAPIALSPFFGMACLSGIATYGPDWLQQRSGLFSEKSPLHNPAFFWTLVTLTIVTTIPRFFKVGKVFALVAEKLETYSVIVLVIGMRMFAFQTSGNIGTEETAMVYMAGIGSVPIDFALAIASAINILIINGVKIFCEFMIWLIPFPFVDAMVEAANKSACVCLTAVYCWSPLVATIINLLLLAVCASVYLWTQRRVRYYIDMVAGSWLRDWLPFIFQPNQLGSIAFLEKPWRNIPRLASVRIREEQGDWLITHSTWWTRRTHRFPTERVDHKSGILSESITLIGTGAERIELLQRRGSDFPAVANRPIEAY